MVAIADERRMTLPLEEITVDARTQPRAGLLTDRVQNLIEVMKERELDPVDIFYDGETYWVGDGFHRIEASRQAGLAEIPVTLFEGGWKEAFLHGLRVNSEHLAQPLSYKDKVVAAKRLLGDEVWGQWSDREIGRQTGLHPTTIGKLRAAICPSQTDTRIVNRGGKVYQMRMRRGDGKPSETSYSGVLTEAPVQSCFGCEKLTEAESGYRCSARNFEVSESEAESIASGCAHYQKKVQIWVPNPAGTVQAPKKEKRQRVAHDYYPTEKEMVQVLLDEVQFEGQVFEPCAGDGAIASHFYGCMTNEPYPREGSEFQPDWCGDASDPAFWEMVTTQGGLIDHSITNPPYEGETMFAILQNAMEYSQKSIAFLLRLSYLEPCKERAEWLDQMADHLTNVIVVSPRPQYRKDTEGSDNITSAWCVWRKDFSWKALGVKPPFKFVRNWRKAA